LDGRRYRDAYWEKELSSKSNLSTRNVLFMKCLEFGDVYLRVPKAKVALLTSFEALLLKAIRDVDFRFRFHQDRDLFNFVCQLQIGHRVVVQIRASADSEGRAGLFMPGWIAYIGEPVPDSGLLFGVLLEIRASADSEGRAGLFMPGWIAYIGEPVPDSGLLFGVLLEIFRF
uniref:SHR-BD domain-containing protein n=1 Tax=Gongylonema pulchrum TaxID=637853 RepID=A0A183EAA9_9BILA